MQTVVDIGRQHAVTDKLCFGRHRWSPDSADVRQDPCLTIPLATIANKRATVHRNGRFFLTIFVAANLNPVAVSGAIAATLSSGDLTQLAARCAPSVPPQILEAVAQTESGLDPYALHDDKTGAREQLTSLTAAEAEAAQWMQQGDSVDVGLMQINSANFQALGLTLQMAFDSCDSMRAGATVLQAAYGGGKTPAEQEVALLMALSRYNTGTPFRGILNGYARVVLTHVKTNGVPIETDEEEVQSIQASPEPPLWNVTAVGDYARMHGAPWLAFPFKALQDSAARFESTETEVTAVPMQEDFIINQ